MTYIQPNLEKYWSLDTGTAISLTSSSENGLSSAEAAFRIKQHGRNTLKQDPRNSPVLIFLHQFKSPITILLIAAALLSMALGEFPDAWIILSIILASSYLGFRQERSAANAVVELMKMVRIHCSILRDGLGSDQALENIVPGDIVLLSAGDVIPGDCLLLESNELYIDEAAFTGESFPVEKNTGIIPEDTPLSGRSNSLLMSSHVISGKARALVIRTGKSTEFGKLSERILNRPAETEFEKGIRHFGYMLMEITLILVILIFAINVILHKPALDSFLFSLALAVGLTPQLLPAIITVNLATGARAMAKKKVIVKRLSSIENFGSMNILCTDKTGTITEGKVFVKEALDIAGNPSEKTLQYAGLNASLQQGFHNPIDDAICSLYIPSGVEFRVKCEIPYDFIRKRLTIQVENDAGGFAVTKGALTAILKICDRAETAAGEFIPIGNVQEAILRKYKDLSAAGYRVLGVSYKMTDQGQDFKRESEFDMIFLGFITLFDPPKKNVRETLDKLRRAGIRVKLITGDNGLVAASIARQIGTAEPVIITGPEIRKLTDAALMRRGMKTDIFAEVEPSQKERIIHCLQKAGNVVGFLGDGINDAPALHSADVGISVASAVDVAKDAADIVLLDQDLDVLNDGVIVGRKTFTNTMKYVFMATSANFGNMFSMAGASLFLSFLPLFPKQILLTNFLTDFPEMAIATDRVDPESIEKPHRWDIHFIQRFMLVFGLLSSVFDYLTFGVLLVVMKSTEKTFQTGWFVESVISASLIVLVVRTRLPFHKSLPGKWLSIATILVLLAVLIIPFTLLGDLFGFTRLPLPFYGWIFLIITGYILSAEILKKWFYKKLKNRS